MNARVTVNFCSCTPGGAKSRRLRRRSFLMKRQKRRNRPTVIQHTSMVSVPITVDLCSPVESSPSCIDLTNDTDESEIVDLTSASDSVVCLDTSFGLSTPQQLPLQQLPRRSQRNHNRQMDNALHLPINIDTVEDDDSSNSEDVLPVFDCGHKNLNVQQNEESAKKKISCPICYDDVERIEKSGKQLVSTVCGHLFCDNCIRESIRVQRCCPNCRKKLTMKQFHPIFI